MEDKNRILGEIDKLIAPNTTIPAEELAHTTTSILVLVYSEESPQVKDYAERLVAIRNKYVPELMREHIKDLCDGVLRGTRRGINAGLTGSIRRQVTGEVLTDMVQLARAALDQRDGDAKNVAAVLAAAAFEDTIRRMGKTLISIMGQDDLSEVLKKLKEAGVMQGTQVGIAQSYLNFRNQALHAHWDKIERESIQSVLGFVEQLLLKHFS